MNRAKDLIQKNQTLTLATAIDNKAWAAPVFYVNIDENFYFFSSPKARHINEALASGQASCTIYEEGTSWQNLLGLQMSGNVLNVHAGFEASKAFLGEFEQMPPKFSAKKINGKRASDRVRRGEEVQMKPKKIRIDSNGIGL